MLEKGNRDYVTRVLKSLDEVSPEAWDGLLARQEVPTPFMRHAYLLAMAESESACPETGWTLYPVTLWQGQELVAASPLYLKSHSRGEYVFDWAWADAYERHGLPYYPKGLVASPFTPVPGSRLLARDADSRAALVQALLTVCRTTDCSSLHLLFGSPQDQAACEAAGMLRREQIQFHWHNAGWPDFEAFLASLQQEKRKKIRQERRKVAEAGVVFRSRSGREMSEAEWALLAQCYQQTYLEHGQSPYLKPGFFEAMRTHMPESWQLFIASRGGRDIAISLIGLQRDDSGRAQVAYGRYWGALERVACLHFEACYYQPIEWCLSQGVQRFEGGAQGEHKLARALLPVSTTSAHWLAHPAFAEAIDRYLVREREHLQGYQEVLQQHSPLRRA